MSNTTGKGGRLPTAHRQAAKEIFLTVYASTHSIRKAAKAAGINKNTPAIWMKNGTLSEKDLAYAEGEYHDEIRERFNYHDFNPFAQMSWRQIRILAYRHLPEYRIRKFGEILVDVHWWNEIERAELKRVIDRNTASAHARRDAYHREQYNQQYEQED